MKKYHVLDLLAMVLLFAGLIYSNKNNEKRHQTTDKRLLAIENTFIGLMTDKNNV